MIKTPLTNIWNLGSIPGQRAKIPHATTRNSNTTMKIEDPSCCSLTQPNKYLKIENK